MLIGAEREAFDSDEYLYEIKMDGVRCVAYIEDSQVDLRNKRNLALLHSVPELHSIHTAVKGRVILDGELVVLKEGKPSFELVQSRVLTTQPAKVSIASKLNPASYVPMDILYQNGQELVTLPLTERKAILREVVTDNNQIAISRVFEHSGVALFRFASEQNLEGIVAKLKTSRYYLGKETKQWIKSKKYIDEDFVACGYIAKDTMISLILGQYDGERLQHKGHVTLGVTRAKVDPFPTSVRCPFGSFPPENDRAVWFSPPFPVCTVLYMPSDRDGRRQARLKRLIGQFA